MKRLLAVLVFVALPASAQQSEHFPSPVEYLSIRIGQTAQACESQVAALLERIGTLTKERDAARAESVAAKKIEPKP